MQANWSLILNVLLLIGVMIAIIRLMKTRRQSLNPQTSQPSLALSEKSFDDIIAVRKVSLNEEKPQPFLQEREQKEVKAKERDISFTEKKGAIMLVILLVAKDKRQLAGYELLQTVLAAGLRFGEGQLFHRHQYPNGQGPILCSLAAATQTGVFDLQNIGGIRLKGLCLFMQGSGNPAIDKERLTIMQETARQLADGLDTHMLDDNRRPFTAQSLARYYQLLNIPEVLHET